MFGSPIDDSFHSNNDSSIQRIVPKCGLLKPSSFSIALNADISAPLWIRPAQQLVAAYMRGVSRKDMLRLIDCEKRPNFVGTCTCTHARGREPRRVVEFRGIHDCRCTPASTGCTATTTCWLCFLCKQRPQYSNLGKKHVFRNNYASPIARLLLGGMRFCAARGVSPNTQHSIILEEATNQRPHHQHAAPRNQEQPLGQPAGTRRSERFDASTAD